MQSLVTRYQKAASEWRKLPRMTSVLQVEYRSREMLVIWTSFCLVHQKCVKDFPLCIKYNIALNWMDLKVAVLSSKTGISALQNVAKYIRNWNNETRGTPLFHLSDQRPTFDFGRTFSESSSEIKTAYEREVECWESHVLEQWNYIERKKEAAVQHRAEISKRNSDLRLVHRPFSTFERDILHSIYKLSFREPAVKIMAVSLLECADRLGFLFEETTMGKMAMGGGDKKTEYNDMCAAQIQRNPLRSLLRGTEEKLVLGYTKESPLLKLRTSSTNAMIQDMLSELQHSWDCHHSQPQITLKASTKFLKRFFMTLLAKVSSRRQMVELYLEQYYSKATRGDREQFLTLANFLPIVTTSDMVHDMVQCAFDDDIAPTLVPNLNVEARQIFKETIIQFLELCVLEDKVERLVWKILHRDNLSDSQLVTELVNVREWNPMEFPYWLAFEMEGRLQIRHEQFVVAQHLIKHPGTVCQLNMGCGKTRVILPMLVLHFTKSSDRRVVRAHFLGSLLSEAIQYMHRYLSASNAQITIFEQPFHRQVGVDSRRLELIRDTLNELKLSGGIQMIAPEHRMSLELKDLELSDDSSDEILDDILYDDQFVDIFDECDALLHHKYHLVYAVGTPIPLCNGIERWQAVEALLRVMTNKTSMSRVAKVLDTSHVSSTSPDYATRLGAYDGTRLMKITEAVRTSLNESLVLDLIDNAPFEMMWMNTYGSGNARSALVTAIIDSTVSLEHALGDHMQKFSPFVNQLLALRGLLAFGVLDHCLEKRYRVDFGIPDSTSRTKRVAIPFRAADVPSEWSEFSHPDVCIGLTLLGYYHGGLNDEEVRTAFSMLLHLDISEQEQQYNMWFTSVKQGLSDTDKKTLCDVYHISLDDKRQLETLCRVYKFCMEAINFYLNKCVFPQDTQQYPQRLSRTAWNLATGTNIGFWGTNDNHRLLPLSVTQHEPDEPGLLATNGNMLDKIQQITRSYEVIYPSPNLSLIPWESVLLFALNQGAQALIDTGALLAGVTFFCVKVVRLENFIEESIDPRALAHLAWRTANMFGTENFFSTILARKDNHVNERVIDIVLMFDNGQVLLISECEADHILKLLWSHRKDLTSCSFSFVNLDFACRSIDRVGEQTNFQDIDRTVPLLSTIACYVYNGGTMLSQQRKALVEPVYRDLLGPLVWRETTLSNFAESRGSSHKWTRSFLHELCCRMDLLRVSVDV
ncbi:hypothetical protein PHMEG_0008957 [Phytophthora megakarya]|uniref:ubiquitinyl hydrolase 1 n=1 Tax=Phytophthora megakarya TaxID=4795 RepID=A0A225WHV8_9STRA|nr:hypothetical protein PHMEG_0008957 [Phytophthora megakarya]